MNRSFVHTGAENKATVSACVIGIVLDHFSGHDRVKHFLCADHSLRMHHLSYRVRQKENSLVGALPDARLDFHETNPNFRLTLTSWACRVTFMVQF